MLQKLYNCLPNKCVIGITFYIMIACLSACGGSREVIPTAAPYGSSSVQRQPTNSSEIVPTQEVQQPTDIPEIVPTQKPQARYNFHVIINGERLSDNAILSLSAQYNMRIQDGRYWYDSYSGAWGYEGGPIQGFTRSGLPLGGKLQADASGGETGVYLNGRELPSQDLDLFINLLGQLPPGDYWLDSHFNFGIVNGTQHISLLALIQQRNESQAAGNKPSSGSGDDGGLLWSQGDCTIIEGSFSCSSSP